MLLDSFMAAALPQPEIALGLNTQAGLANGRIVAAATTEPDEASDSSGTSYQIASSRPAAAEQTSSAAAGGWPECSPSDRGEVYRKGSVGDAEKAADMGSNRPDDESASSSSCRTDEPIGSSSSSRADDEPALSSSSGNAAETTSSCSTSSPHQEAVARAAAQWGMRLEVGGCGGKALAKQRPPKRSLGRRAMAGRLEADPSVGARCAPAALACFAFHITQPLPPVPALATCREAARWCGTWLHRLSICRPVLRVSARLSSNCFWFDRFTCCWTVGERSCGHCLERCGVPSCAPAGWPAIIPWRGAAGGEPRFVCDVMCEGLARQLRLCGLDARSAPLVGKAQRFRAYRCAVPRLPSPQAFVPMPDTCVGISPARQ